MESSIEIAADAETIKTLHDILKEHVDFFDGELFGKKYPSQEARILAEINRVEPVIAQIVDHCAKHGITLPVRDKPAPAAEHFDDGILGDDLPF